MLVQEATVVLNVTFEQLGNKNQLYSLWWSDCLINEQGYIWGVEHTWQYLAGIIRTYSELLSETMGLCNIPKWDFVFNICRESLLVTLSLLHFPAPDDVHISRYVQSVVTV